LIARNEKFWLAATRDYRQFSAVPIGLVEAELNLRNKLQSRAVGSAAPASTIPPRRAAAHVLDHI
jgi:hypothetical protein